MNFSGAAFYKLDDGAGTAVADALGNAPDLSVIGTGLATLRAAK